MIYILKTVKLIINNLRRYGQLHEQDKVQTFQHVLAFPNVQTESCKKINCNVKTIIF